MSDTSYVPYYYADSVPTSPMEDHPSAQGVVNSEKKKYSIGVDLGTSKVTISRSDLSKQNVCPEVIADMMDIRNIPNRVLLPSEKGQTRMFGNSASAHRSFVSRGYAAGAEDDLTEKYDVVIGDKKYSLPLYIIKTMIMGHVNKIIDHRAEPVDSKELSQEAKQDSKQGSKKSIVVIVPSYSASAKNVFFEAMGSALSLTASMTAGDNEDRKSSVPRIKTISCVNALIFSYLERHILCLDAKIDVPKKHVLIADMGQSKTQFFVFSIHRIRGDVFIEHKDYISPGKLSGDHIDDLFVEAMAQRVKGSYPRFRINKSGDTDYQNNRFFRANVMKLKHQLSINQSVSFTLQGIDEDITFTVTRKEFDDVIRSNELETLMRTTLTFFRDVWDDVPLDHVEFIGGCSRIPLFKETFKTVFKGVSIGTMNVDESVANGASVYGWLLQNKDVAKTIHYIRSVRNPVAIRYPAEGLSKTAYSYVSPSSLTTKDKTNDENKVHKLTKSNLSEREVVIHERLDKIFSTFSRSDNRATKFCLEGNKKDTTCTRVSSSNEIDIVVGNLVMHVALQNLSDTNLFIDVNLKYAMSDVVEIIGITDSNNNPVQYTVSVSGSKDTTKSEDPFTTLVRDYASIEEQILAMEKIVERRQEFANFMETYYLDKDAVNDLINVIARDQIEKGTSVEISIQNVDDQPITALVPPLKEVYEFYQFCRSYCEDPDTDEKRAKKLHIDTILSDDYSLKQMERAAQIIKTIKGKYCR